MTHKPTPLTDKFISDLKTKMDHEKIHQTKLASDIGVTKQHIHNWIKGITRPSAEYLLRMQNWVNEKLS